MAASLACSLAGCGGGTDPLAAQQAMRASQATPASLVADGQPRALIAGVQSSSIGALPDTVSFDGTINTMAIAANGTTYLGGSFTRASTTTGSGVPLDAVTSLPANFPVIADGQVLAVAADGAGGWYVGGTFKQVGDTPRTRLAHVLADNTVDATFDPKPNDSVTALAVSATGTLYAGGRFTEIGNLERNRLAAFAGNGELLPWNPNASGPVNVLTVCNETVYVGGAFAFVGATISRNRLAGFNAADALIEPGKLLAWNPNADHEVKALACAGGVVYAGGLFSNIGNQVRARLAAIEAGGAGTVVPTWNPSPNGAVNALAVEVNDAITLYVGGSFTTVTHLDGTSRSRKRLAAIGANGGVSAWDPQPNNTINALTLADDTLYAGGIFSSLAQPDGTVVARNRLAAISVTGAVLPWDPSAYDAVNVLANAGAVIFAGGAFPSVGGQVRNRLAALDASGALLPWNPNANNTVNSLVLSDDGAMIYAGGAFIRIGTTAVNRVAAIGADGVVPASWRKPAVNDVVNALDFSGGILYLGGRFTAIGTAQRHRLAAMTADGAVTPWAPLANDVVNAVRAAGSMIYVGGAFTQINSQDHGRLAAIAPDGTLSGWSPSLDGAVNALAASTSTLFVGGAFLNVDGAPHNRLAAFNLVDAASEPGSLLSWSPKVDNGVVSALALDGATLYVGGTFTAIGGTTRSRLAAINTDSGALLAFDPGANGGVSALAVRNGTLYAVGAFTALNGSLRGHVGTVPTTYAIEATITGLRGESVVLQTNGTNNFTASADGTFVIQTGLASGSPYDVEVVTQPSYPAQDCVVANGSDLIENQDAKVVVTCSDLQAAQLRSVAGVRSAQLSWTVPTYAKSFNVYFSSARDCDVRNYANCPDGALLPNVAPSTSFPFPVSNLLNRQAYYFVVETCYENLACGLSNRTGARPDELTFNNTVNALAPAVNGDVYIGGNFTKIGIAHGSLTQFDAATGQTEPSFPVVSGGRVLAVVPDGAGGWFIGGFFTRVGTEERQGLAHILADGSVDANFDVAVNGVVNALAAARGRLYLGGAFSQVNGEFREGLAAIEADGSLAGWNVQVRNPQRRGIVYALAVKGEQLYVGGDFDRIVKQISPVVSESRLNLAAFNTLDAALGAGELQPWKPTMGPAGCSIRALATLQNTLYVGGNCPVASGQTRIGVAAFNTLDLVFRPGALLPWDPHPNSAVSAIATDRDTIYLAGPFTGFTDRSGKFQPHQRVAAIAADAEGTVSPLWNAGIDDGSVETIAVGTNGVYVGGDFRNAGGQPRDSLAAFKRVDAESPGSLLSWTPSAPDNVVRVLAASDEAVYAGGDFTGLGSVERTRLALISPAGTLRPWNPRVLASSVNGVNGIALLDDTVYVGGGIFEVNGTTRNGLAAITAGGSGELVPTWAPSVGQRVHALARLGRFIYVGGSFSAPRAGLMAIDKDTGGLVPNFPIVGDDFFLPTVNAIATPLGAVYVGGQFSSLGGLLRGNLGGMGGTGSMFGWNPGPNAPVNALAVSASRVYVGGEFNLIRGTQRFSLAATERLTSNVITSFDAHLDPADEVHELALSGNTLYVGGSFAVGGNLIALLSLDATSGARNGNFKASIERVAFTRTINALAAVGGKLYVGGDFLAVNGAPRRGLAILNADDGTLE